MRAEIPAHVVPKDAPTHEVLTRLRDIHKQLDQCVQHKAHSMCVAAAARRWHNGKGLHVTWPSVC